MRRFTTVVAAFALMLPGCAPRGGETRQIASKQQDDPEKQWKGQIRQDLDPLKKRLKNTGDSYM